MDTTLCIQAGQCLKSNMPDWHHRLWDVQFSHFWCFILPATVIFQASTISRFPTRAVSLVCLECWVVLISWPTSLQISKVMMGHDMIRSTVGTWNLDNILRGTGYRYPTDDSTCKGMRGFFTRVRQMTVSNMFFSLGDICSRELKQPTSMAWFSITREGHQPYHFHTTSCILSAWDDFAACAKFGGYPIFLCFAATLSTRIGICRITWKIMVGFTYKKGYGIFTYHFGRLVYLQKRIHFLIYLQCPRTNQKFWTLTTPLGSVFHEGMKSTEPPIVGPVRYRNPLSSCHMVY